MVQQLLIGRIPRHGHRHRHRHPREDQREDVVVGVVECGLIALSQLNTIKCTSVH